MGSAHRAGWFRGEYVCCLSAAPPLVADATTLPAGKRVTGFSVAYRLPTNPVPLPPPIQGALWVLSNGGNLSLWQQRSENHTTGLRPGENKPTALTGDGNAPLLPPVGDVFPGGGDFSALCIEMFMSLETERRENFPLRGKWCDSTKRGAFPARRRRGCMVFHSAKRNYKTHRRQRRRYHTL